jgi:hypothetical protein
MQLVSNFTIYHIVRCYDESKQNKSNLSDYQLFHFNKKNLRSLTCQLIRINDDSDKSEMKVNLEHNHIKRSFELYNNITKKINVKRRL